MNDWEFNFYLDACKYVSEETSFLEILNYSDPVYNSIEEHPLTPDELHNFCHGYGAYELRRVPEGIRFLNGIRLVLQKDAKHPDTFSPMTLSLRPSEYDSMVRTFHLPFRAIEGTSVVGPFFWSNLDHEPNDPHLHIIFRKADVRKKGKTRGWEVILSYSFNTSVTTGFVKGTTSSDIMEAIKQLKSMPESVKHPLLLPLILISLNLGAKTDMRQRDVRDWLRTLEHTITSRAGQLSMEELGTVSRDIVECHAQLLWQRPQAYFGLIDQFEVAMDRFKSGISIGLWTPEMNASHYTMLGKLDFLRRKLEGLEVYASTTMERLNRQRDAIINIMSHREAISNLQVVEMLTEQRRLAQASMKDNSATKRLSLLGATFLPGTFLASLFSMVFFDVKDADAGELGNLVVSPQLWVYFVITIPLTVIIVATLRFWDRRQEMRKEEREEELGTGVEELENDIITSLRRRIQAISGREEQRS
ncbi:hypothetical protein F4779DRAFT_629972 [Xylariaceae sp. FL0662B]|nr:hypothetical protein F4779DRAFT_632517 [Xylariaceae sp. FL0662B]KAI0005815.1 hypothetical protein F4779DRAFT_629972 [Xylariaceae sp. FL0662B]